MMFDTVNEDLLTQTGRVFYLTATVDEILTKVAKDSGNRPLLAASNCLKSKV
jgi:hypothetical protein